MSVGEHLFVRGMISDENDDMWDDTQLIKAYDKAMKSYKPAEMAKRIAMATNAKSGEKSKPKWRVGSACRAVYEGDGVEYEAYIIELLDKGECVIRFVGYGDDATVPLKDLKPSHGTAARSEQVYNITTEPSWKEIVKSEFGVEESALDSASEAETLRSRVKNEEQAATSSRHSDSPRHRKNKNKKHKRKHQNQPPFPSFLDTAKLPMDAMHPYAGEFPGLSSLPPLPPILPPGPGESDHEHEILNSMLTAWYMSGYYAGLYHSCIKKKSKKSS